MVEKYATLQHQVGDKTDNGEDDDENEEEEKESHDDIEGLNTENSDENDEQTEDNGLPETSVEDDKKNEKEIKQPKEKSFHEVLELKAAKNRTDEVECKVFQSLLNNSVEEKDNQTGLVSDVHTTKKKEIDNVFLKAVSDPDETNNGVPSMSDPNKKVEITILSDDDLDNENIDRNSQEDKSGDVAIDKRDNNKAAMSENNDHKESIIPENAVNRDTRENASPKNIVNEKTKSSTVSSADQSDTEHVRVCHQSSDKSPIVSCSDNIVVLDSDDEVGKENMSEKEHAAKKELKKAINKERIGNDKEKNCVRNVNQNKAKDPFEKREEPVVEDDDIIITGETISAQPETSALNQSISHKEITSSAQVGICKTKAKSHDNPFGFYLDTKIITSTPKLGHLSLDIQPTLLATKTNSGSEKDKVLSKLKNNAPVSNSGNPCKPPIKMQWETSVVSVNALTKEAKPSARSILDKLNKVTASHSGSISKHENEISSTSHDFELCRDMNRFHGNRVKESVLTHISPSRKVISTTLKRDKGKLWSDDENASLIETYQEPDSTPYNLEENLITSSSHDSLIILSDSD